MKDAIKKFLRPFVPRVIHRIYKKKRQLKEVLAWQKRGCYTPPPHLVKQLTIKVYQQKYKCDTLVETGTYMGEMVEALKTRFRKIISIELATELYKKAKKRFILDRHVTIMKGDSGKVLPKILPKLKHPAIFWLDGHYSKGVTAKGDKACPIFEELNSIFNSQKLNHILLIDDARCFIGEDDYPTIDSLIEFIRDKNNMYQVEVKHDIIRCVAQA